MKDDPRSGHPKSVTTSEIINKVHDIVLEDRRLNVSEIAKASSVPVNYYTGIPQISIPFCQNKLPISLNYFAGGVKVDEFDKGMAGGAGL